MFKNSGDETSWARNVQVKNGRGPWAKLPGPKCQGGAKRPGRKHAGAKRPCPKIPGTKRHGRETSRSKTAVGRGRNFLFQNVRGRNVQVQKVRRRNVLVQNVSGWGGGG